MADPDGFIEITDFSPGIYGDFHASGAPIAETTADAMEGASLQTGRATIENTYRCRSDATGALTPLPLIEPHTYDIVPLDGRFNHNALATPVDNGRGEEVGGFILDAIVGPESSIDLPSGSPSNRGDIEFRQSTGPQSVYVMYGFYFNPYAEGLANGYAAYVLGREYRPYIAEPGVANTVVDFLLTRTESYSDSVNTLGTLPFAQLVVAFYNKALDGDSPSLDGQDWNAVVVMLVQPPDPYVTESARRFVNPTAPTVSYTITDQEMTHKVFKGTSGVPQQLLTHWTPLAGTTQRAIMGMSLPLTSYKEPPDFDPIPYLWSLRYNTAAQLLNQTTAITSHQGRLVGLERRTVPADRYFDAAMTRHERWHALLSLTYSPYGLPIGRRYTLPSAPIAGQYPGGYAYDLPDTSFEELVIAEDNLSMAGAIGTVTTDQLLVVKHKGGGILISGDLDNPTVRRMPGIESTHGVVVNGTQSPIGFVYGSRRGIFAWAGGDKSVKLSTQIDGFFWDHIGDREPFLSHPTYQGAQGRLAFWNQFVCVPNNYVLDIDHGGWWRLKHDTGDYPFNNYLVDGNGDLLATPYKVTRTQNVAIYKASQEHLDWRYSWQSHPIVGGSGRRVSIQDVRLLATANSITPATIKVTVNGFDPDGTEAVQHSELIPMASLTSKPQMIRRDIQPNFQADYVQVRIEAWTAARAGLRIGGGYLGATSNRESWNPINDTGFELRTHFSPTIWRAINRQVLMSNEDPDTFTGHAFAFGDPSHPGVLSLKWGNGNAFTEVKSTTTVTDQVAKDFPLIYPDGLNDLRDARVSVKLTPRRTGEYRVEFLYSIRDGSETFTPWKRVGDVADVVSGPYVDSTLNYKISPSFSDLMYIYTAEIIDTFTDTMIASPNFSLMVPNDELGFTDVDNRGLDLQGNEWFTAPYPIVRMGWAPKVHNTRFGISERARTRRHG